MLHLPPTTYHMPHVTYHMLPTKISPPNTTCYMLPSTSLTVTRTQNWTSWWIRSANTYVGVYYPVRFCSVLLLERIVGFTVQNRLGGCNRVQLGNAWECAWEGTSDDTSECSWKHLGYLHESTVECLLGSILSIIWVVLEIIFKSVLGSILTCILVTVLKATWRWTTECMLLYMWECTFWYTCNHTSATTWVPVRNTQVFWMALTTLTERCTLWWRITHFLVPRRWVALHTYLVNIASVMWWHIHIIRTTCVLHCSQGLHSCCSR